MSPYEVCLMRIDPKLPPPSASEAPLGTCIELGRLPALPSPITPDAEDDPSPPARSLLLVYSSIPLAFCLENLLVLLGVVGTRPLPHLQPRVSTAPVLNSACLGGGDPAP
jgi:hypothetical protein